MRNWKVPMVLLLGLLVLIGVASYIAPENLILQISTPAKFRVGEVAPIRLVLKNEGFTFRKVEIGNDARFTITNERNERVWEGVQLDRDGPSSPDILILTSTKKFLWPWGHVELAEVSWDLRDNGGESVPPGTYFVEGSVSMGNSMQTVSSEPSRFEIGQ